MDYLEVKIEVTPRNPWSEILVAELADLGFESFVDSETGVDAYAPVTIGDLSNLFSQTSLNENPEVQINYTST
ncbi:MAG: 50S ribosomal protein L11 methyltransferase, partial [Fluviicola sp.]